MNNKFSLLQIINESSFIDVNEQISGWIKPLAKRFKFADDVALKIMAKELSTVKSSVYNSAKAYIKNNSDETISELLGKVPIKVKEASQQLAFKRLVEAQKGNTKTVVKNNKTVEEVMVPLTQRKIDDIINSTKLETQQTWADALSKKDQIRNSKTSPKSSKKSFLPSWFGRKGRKINIPPNAGQQTQTLLTRIWKIGKKRSMLVLLFCLVALGYTMRGVIYEAIMAFFGLNPLPDMEGDDVPQNVKDWNTCILGEFDGKYKMDSGLNVGWDGNENSQLAYVVVYMNTYLGESTGGWVKFWQNYDMLSANGETGKWSCGGSINEELTEDIDLEVSKDADLMVDYLDFPASRSDLKKAHELLMKYEKNGKGKKFLSAYYDAGLMDASLETSLKYTYFTDSESNERKKEMISIIKKIEGSSSKSSNNSGNSDGKLIARWDKKPEVKPVPVTVPPKTDEIKYRPCDDFPFTKGCINEKIKDIQRCLNPNSNLKVDGYYGPKTHRALINFNAFADNDPDDEKITEVIYKKVTEDICLSKNSEEKSKEKEGSEKKPEDLKKVEITPIPIKKYDAAAALEKYGKETLDKLKLKRVDGNRIVDLMKNKLRFTPAGRYVLTDQNDITEEQLEVINKWMTSIGYSHDPVKVKRTDKGVKYVWTALDRDARRVARLQNKIDNIKDTDDEE